MSNPWEEARNAARMREQQAARAYPPAEEDYAAAHCASGQLASMQYGAPLRQQFASTQRVPEISQELEGLAQEIAACGESWLRLLERLMPVMPPQHDGAPVPGEKEAPEPQSQLGCLIRMNAGQVRALRRGIEDATRKVLL